MMKPRIGVLYVICSNELVLIASQIYESGCQRITLLMKCCQDEREKPFKQR